MNDEHATIAAERQHPAAIDSQQAPRSSSRKPALLCEADLLARSFLTVPETGFLMRTSVRTVWRLMADPKSGFPSPRRVRGRTLLACAEVLAFLEGASR